jgi:DNA-binding NarL/FixJ family response regulator
MEALPSNPPKARVSFFVQKLTSRETEVLRLIARGLRNKQVAAQLGISPKTVEKHRQQVMNKLNIHDVAGLTRYAISQELTEMDLPVAV